MSVGARRRRQARCAAPHEARRSLKPRGGTAHRGCEATRLVPTGFVVAAQPPRRQPAYTGVLLSPPDPSFLITHTALYCTKTGLCWRKDAARSGKVEPIVPLLRRLRPPSSPLPTPSHPRHPRGYLAKTTPPQSKNHTFRYASNPHPSPPLPTPVLRCRLPGKRVREQRLQHCRNDICPRVGRQGCHDTWRSCAE